MNVSKVLVKKLAVVATFGLAATLLSGEHAEAATDVTTFNVDVVVNAYCDILATPVAFSAYDPGASVDLDTAGGVGGTSGVISVDCTQNINFAFAFDGGTNVGATTVRAMDDGAGVTLDYRLELAATNADIPAGATVATGVGDGYDGVAPLTGLQTWTIDGVIPASQSVAGGNYQDTVTATLNY